MAARSYRHQAARSPAARSPASSAGRRSSRSSCGSPGRGQQAAIIAGAVVIGLICVAAGVATGRGWRSVWWSRRAEVAEVMAGSFGIGATVVASGLFRALWEINS